MKADWPTRSFFLTVFAALPWLLLFALKIIGNLEFTRGVIIIGILLTIVVALPLGWVIGTDPKERME